ncbi:2-5A-dependent ribonuclease [Centrocercus urophasianus]|uniref:2-5A-dependent ribonuclease n=1 Tax=Centrocercus urophasianus TaxID=9002 RepID=UPI001C647C32|nr:2-5A-dependent ribonuclease [Centrocercus urophasianus]
MEPRAHIQKEASSMQRAENIASELNDALRYGQREKVLELLENGADVNSKVEFGWTPLQSAVQSGDKEMVQLLLAKGACPYTRKDNGGTAFIEAAMVGDVEILELLFGCGFNVNDSDDNGFTAFMEAALYGKEEALRFLHSKGADVNLRRTASEEKKKLSKGGKTALMDACLGGHFSVVKTLIQEMGADVNICDNEGRNALIHALKDNVRGKNESDVFEIGRFLLERGVDVNCKDEAGKTALILAVQRKNTSLVEALLDRDDIKIDEAGEDGRTALAVAVEKNTYDIAEMLCKKGARTDTGELVAVANRNRASEMACLLLKYNTMFVPTKPDKWEPKSKRWRHQLQSLHKMYRPMIGKLKVFQHASQRIQDNIYLGLYDEMEVAVWIHHRAEGVKEKTFLGLCGSCEHLLKLFQSEQEKGCMYLCFPLWEKNLEEHLQDPEDQKDPKGILKMIFQAVRELHSLGFAHQSLHPKNFLIDLGGKIYLTDFDSTRKLTEGKTEVINKDLENLSKLMLYVLTGGRKPLNEVSTKDMDAGSMDYEEALDLIDSLASHDERGLEDLSEHPYFWSKQKKFNVLKNIWNKIKDLTDDDKEDAFTTLNAGKPILYPNWIKQIDREILRIMTNVDGKKKFYEKNIAHLLRFIRNLDEHPNKRISEIAGDHAEYFLKLFPKLTIHAYNRLCRHPRYSHFIDIQDPSS